MRGGRFKETPQHEVSWQIDGNYVDGHHQKQPQPRRHPGLGMLVIESQAMFERTQAWMHARKLFDVPSDGGVSSELVS
jgi:hypothetical protein